MITLRRHGDDTTGGETIVEMVLDRPEAMNAISTSFAERIAATTRELADDANVRVVLLTSSHPKAFCVGADLKERNSFTDADLMAQRPVTRNAYTGVLDLPMPTIAVVEGFALGGGLELALSCDMIVAGEQALLGLPEVSVGVIPGGGGTQLLSRRIGSSRAARAILTAAKYSAAQAHDIGFVDELTTAGEANAKALEMAMLIARNSPVGCRNAKKALRRGLDVDLHAGLEIEDACWRATAFSADRSEGVRAFAEKRTPRWPGR